MASLRDTLANLVEQYKQSDTPLANLMRGDTEGAKQSVANALQQATQDPYSGLNVLGTTKIVSKTAQELAHELASKNAEKMLGLPAGNTAMERAKALGFDVENPVYHGTGADISKFDLRGKFRKGGAGYFVTEDPITAAYYAGNTNARFPSHNPNVMKLVVNPKSTFDYTNPEHLSKMGEQINKLNDAELVRYGYYYPPENWLDRISTGDWATLENKGMMKALKKAGFDSAKIKEAEQPNTMLLNNKNLRSINAAFDPKLTGTAAIAAGTASADLLADEDKQKLIKALKQQ